MKSLKAILRVDAKVRPRWSGLERDAQFTLPRPRADIRCPELGALQRSVGPVSSRAWGCGTGWTRNRHPARWPGTTCQGAHGLRPNACHGAPHVQVR